MLISSKGWLIFEPTVDDLQTNQFADWLTEGLNDSQTRQFSENSLET